MCEVKGLGKIPKPLTEKYLLLYDILKLKGGNSFVYKNKEEQLDELY